MSWDDFRPPTNSRWYSAADLPEDGSVITVTIGGLSVAEVHRAPTEWRQAGRIEWCSECGHSFRWILEMPGPA